MPPTVKSSVSARLPLSVAFPPTANVPATVVLPVVLTTLNLFVLTVKSPATAAVEFKYDAPDTVNELRSNAVPYTSAVPSVTKLPVAESTVRAFVPTVTLPATPRVESSVVPPLTRSVEFNCELLATENVEPTSNEPAILVAPVADDTVNLFVAILKFCATPNVPAILVLPELPVTINLLELIANVPDTPNEF